MKTLKLYILAIFLMIASYSAANTDDVSFVANSESVVAMGDKFQVTFTLNNADSDNFTLPTMEGFRILYGPNKSSSTRMSITNGKTVKSSSVTLSYMLTPLKEGTFTISPAKVTIDGKVIRTNALTIKVIKGEERPANQQQNPQQQTATISNDDIFVKTEVSKSKVYEQEQFLATTKIYYRANLSSIEDLKLPEYKGFTSQDVEITGDRYGKENINGKVYQTYIIKKNLLTPQKSGQIDLGKGTLSITAKVQVNSNRGGWPFDGFFSQVREVQKTLNIPNVSINVQPLPQKGKPENFSGAVGSFTLNSSIKPTEGYKTNEGITIKVQIQGTGNLKYAKAPEITFPNDFEIYDPKVDNKVKVTESGNTGVKEIEYLAIPRYPGEYEIPASEFSYFDLKTKSYKTLKTDAYKFTVEKGTESENSNVAVSNYTTKESVKYHGSGDIRFINKQNYSLNPKNSYFYGSLAYVLWFVIPIILFIIVYLFLRKLAAENSNLALVKNRKANKQAIKKLKQAEKYKLANESSAFYEEVMKALYGYASDKMNIPAKDLTKSNVKTELTGHNVSEETSDEFIKLLDTCEFARFAPTAVSGSLEDIYNNAVSIIEKLQNEIR